MVAVPEHKAAWLQRIRESDSALRNSSRDEAPHMAVVPVGGI